MRRHVHPTSSRLFPSHTVKAGAYLLAILGIGISGCRTYGGHGTPAATYTEIGRVIERFDGELSRAQADLAALDRASETDPFLELVAARYGRIVEAHKAILDEQREVAGLLSADATYRSLNRVFGSLVAEQHTLRNQYERLLRYAISAYEPDTATVQRSTRPYALVPPYYDRISEDQRDVTVNDVLRAARTGLTPSATALRTMAASEAAITTEEVPATTTQPAHEDG